MNKTESPLQKELQINNAFKHLHKIQEARIIAPDLIEWMEDMYAEIISLRHSVAALISQNVRRELKEKKKAGNKEDAKAQE